MEIEETDIEVLEAAARMWDNLFDKLLGGEGHYEKEKRACEAMGMTYREIPKGDQNG